MKINADQYQSILINTDQYGSIADQYGSIGPFRLFIDPYWSVIDPLLIRYWSIKINSGSISDQYGSMGPLQLAIDPYWSAIDLYWSVLIHIDLYWSVMIGIDRSPNLHRSIDPYWSYLCYWSDWSYWSAKPWYIKGRNIKICDARAINIVTCQVHPVLGLLHLKGYGGGWQ